MSKEVCLLIKSSKSWDQEMPPKFTVLSLVKKPRVTHTSSPH